MSDDVHHVLACCERLVTALAPPRVAPAGGHPDAALVEALWTSALLAYARAFAPRAGVLTTTDLEALGLPGDVLGFHDLLLRLREQYGSVDANPRESCSVGVVEGDDGIPVGVAVMAAPLPLVDQEAARQLGRLAYALNGRVDGRMEEVQARVLHRARELTQEELAALPLVRVDP
ncbi:MAG: hypothetical protein M3P46_00785 [Actinomycetota bacterium]|nr:hypothetical protein [Actinomycetota bacterium]